MGEGVHFFDLANWLLGQAPASVSAAFVGPAAVTNPDGAVTIRYPDESLAVVHYTTLGSTAMGKEYFEVFGHGRSARCDDYQRFSASGGSGSVPNGARGNKGQLEVLAEFARKVRGETTEVQGADATDGLLATWITVAAYESATAGTAISVPRTSVGRSDRATGLCLWQWTLRLDPARSDARWSQPDHRPR